MRSTSAVPDVRPADLPAGPEDMPLAQAIAVDLEEFLPDILANRPNGYTDRTTPVTQRLLSWWFSDELCEIRAQQGLPNFHRGQRDAILAIIYAHEILGATTLDDLYRKVGNLPAGALLDGDRLTTLNAYSSKHPKYLAKMGTGTGKTWVMNAILVWQYLNALAAPADPRYTTNFLVVAPGLIVYDRLLDSLAGKRDEHGQRDYATSDLASHRQLFLPDADAGTVLGFVQGAVTEKQDIGVRTAPGGIVAVTNWHMFLDRTEQAFQDDEEEEDEVVAPGEDLDPRDVAHRVLPLTPGTAKGNSLDTLDGRSYSDRAPRWLKSLPSLLVFNDEAHHIHGGTRTGVDDAVEWQKALDALSRSKENGSDGRTRLTQVDFSATPFIEVTRGRGRNKSAGRRYFDHIVVDYDIRAAMHDGHVKALTLEKRSELASLRDDQLDYKAERNSRGEVIGLSDGQKIMLAAGLIRLQSLEAQFADHNPNKRPKMLVVLEDTSVAPYVEDYLKERHCTDDDILTIHSNRKNEVTADEWERIRDRLFSLDEHPTPRIIISVLMLREGFDVNNICVIVPLRTAASGVLLEQIVGRGLRLMWRGDSVIDEAKKETRELIRAHREPKNYYDLLFVVDHPAFDEWYRTVLGGDLVGETSATTTRATGDIRMIGLRDGYDGYDFAIPVMIRPAEQELDEPTVNVDELPVCTLPLDQLRHTVGRAETFTAFDVQDEVTWGELKVDEDLFTVSSYREMLAKMTERVAAPVARIFTRGGDAKKVGGSDEPILQMDRVAVLAIVKRYVETVFFGGAFDPAVEGNWRVLCVAEVERQIEANVRAALVASLNSTTIRDPQVITHTISEVTEIPVSDSSGVDVTKCVYPRLPIPRHGGGWERDFIDWADHDASVEAFVKIHEYRHGFLRRPYMREDGMLATYSPDFLVRTASTIFLVETKSDRGVSHPDVQRKRRAALHWISTVNELPPSLRSERAWQYVLLGETEGCRYRDSHTPMERALALAQFVDTGRRSAPQLF